MPPAALIEVVPISQIGSVAPVSEGVTTQAIANFGGSSGAG